MKSKQDQAPQWREDVPGRKPRAAWRWDQREPFGNNVPDENPGGVRAFEFPLRFPGPAWLFRSQQKRSRKRSIVMVVVRDVEHQVLGSRAERSPGHDVRLAYSLSTPVADAVWENAPQPGKFGVREETA